MAKNDRKKCTVAFQSIGDFRSAQYAAEKWGIDVTDLSEQSKFLLSIPADSLRLFQSLGSIHFGINIRI